MTSTLRAVCCAAVLWALLGARSLAIDSPPQAPSPQSFRAGVNLLAIDVTVVDDDGRPVRGLAAEDFVVSLAGVRVPVRALDYREFGSGRDSAAVPAGTTEDVRAPAIAGASRGGRVILILIDDLSTKPGDGTGLRVGARRMLASTDSDDLVGLVTTSGLGPVVSPTRDRAAIAAAIEHRGVVGRNDDSAAPFYVTVPEAIEIDRDVRGALARVARRECAMTSAVDCPSSVESAARRLARHAAIRSESQAAAYVAVIEALRTAPAPRVIVALSAGLVLRSDRDASAALSRVANAAAVAGVQFYALTEVADGADARRGSGTRLLVVVSSPDLLGHLPIARGRRGRQRERRQRAGAAHARSHEHGVDSDERPLPVLVRR